MKYFMATLKFDYGKFKLLTCASDKESAINKICTAENCPTCAIIHIEEHSGAGYTIK